MRAQKVDNLIMREIKQITNVAAIGGEHPLMLSLDAVALEKLARPKARVGF